MANFPGTSGADSLVGTDGIADNFTFALSNLSADDTVIGGTGGPDILRLTTSGTVTAAMLAHVSGLEQINLAATGNDLGLDDAFLTANGNRITILGNDLANTVTISSLSFQTVTFLAQGGGDTILGGLGAETVEASAAVFGDLGGGDDTLRLTNRAAVGGGLAGGLGTDLIALSVGGAWNLSSYSGFEEITLAGATTLTMAAESGQRVEGSIKRDVITLGASGQTVWADRGDDEVRASFATLTRSVLIGGDGYDTLVLTGGGRGHRAQHLPRLRAACGRFGQRGPYGPAPVDFGRRACPAQCDQCVGERWHLL